VSIPGILLVVDNFVIWVTLNEDHKTMLMNHVAFNLFLVAGWGLLIAINFSRNGLCSVASLTISCSRIGHVNFMNRFLAVGWL
jgi:hypothetical protein